MENFFYGGWDGLARILIVGTLGYAGLIVSLRVSGKRTLAKMNAFDLIVTVSLGSILASLLLNKNVPLAEGVLAFTLLIGLQFVITWASVRLQWFRKLVTGEPRMLLERGRFLQSELRQARVTEGEVRAAVRSAGIYDLGGVEAVVLETDGSFSVISGSNEGGASSLSDVRSPTEAARHS